MQELVTQGWEGNPVIPSNTTIVTGGPTQDHLVRFFFFAPVGRPFFTVFSISENAASTDATRANNFFTAKNRWIGRIAFSTRIPNYYWDK